MSTKGTAKWRRSKNRRRGRKAVEVQVKIKESAASLAADATGRKARFGTWAQALEFFREANHREVPQGPLAS